MIVFKKIKGIRMGHIENSLRKGMHKQKLEVRQK